MIFKYTIFIYLFYCQLTQINVQVTYPIFFNEEEVRHARDAVDDFKNMSVHHCDEDKLVNTLVNIRVSTPESIVMLSFFDGQILCGNILNKVNDIKKYLKTCVISQNNLYVKLLKGVNALLKLLCYDSDFFEKFELYLYCFKELERDFEICSGPMDWHEERNKKKVCRTFRKMADCYYIKIAKVCGLEGAKIFKKLIISSISPVIVCSCDLRKNPMVPDPMPEMYVRKSIIMEPKDKGGRQEPSSCVIILCIIFLLLRELFSY